MIILISVYFQFTR